jgi:hypothetical protein
MNKMFGHRAGYPSAVIGFAVLTSEKKIVSPFRAIKKKNFFDF